MVGFFGNASIFLVALAVTLMFGRLKRKMRPGEGGGLILAGLAVLSLGAFIDLVDRHPVWAELGVPHWLVHGPGYGFYTLSCLLSGLGIARWLPVLSRMDGEIAARQAAEGALQAALERTRRFQSGLEGLARQHLQEAWNARTLRDEAVRRVSGLLGVARVSVWTLDADGQALECVAMYRVDGKPGIAGTRLPRSMNPAYFDAIASGRTVCVVDALTDPVTAAFGSDYLTPQRVGALLDAPILSGRGVRGVLCCEHVGGPRVWSPEEVSCANAVAQYVAVAFLAESAERLAGKLQDALRAAEAASEAKSVFLANMSHELRTPLNGVLGLARALEEAGLPETEADKARLICESGRQLLGVLNDVLDLSRIEAGQIDIAPEPVDPRALIGDACALFAEAARRKGLAFGVSAGDLPTALAVDPVRVRQVLSNLVSNAVKFTESGAVHVEAGAVVTAPGRWRLEIAVTDTGCGLSAAALGRLFERFSQVDASASRQHGGAGLGLVIARQLARAMDGDITVQSRPGEGSRFTFTLDADAAAPHGDGAGETGSGPAVERAAPAGQARLCGARVLLVDDNEVNRFVARCFLEPAGAVVTEADSGEAAIACAAGAGFDLIVLDGHMPGLSGLETLARLRAGPQADTPVMAMTADAMTGDAARYLAAGMDGYVPKPVDKTVFLAECERLLGAGRRPVRASGAA